MSLADFDAELEATGPAHRPCGFCKKIAILDKKQRASLDEALDCDRYTAPVIVRVLAKWGVETNEVQVQKHRPFGSTARLKFCATKYPNGKPGR